VGPRAALDDVEKRKFLALPGLELRPLGRPARNQSLYRVRYLGTSLLCNNFFNLYKNIVHVLEPAIMQVTN
jgi:hypothetical protein